MTIQSQIAALAAQMEKLTQAARLEEQAKALAAQAVPFVTEEAEYYRLCNAAQEATAGLMSVDVRHERELTEVLRRMKAEKIEAARAGQALSSQAATLYNEMKQAGHVVATCHRSVNISFLGLKEIARLFS